MFRMVKDINWDIFGIFPDEEQYEAKIEDVESFLKNIKKKTNHVYSRSVFTMPAPYLWWSFNSFTENDEIYIRDDRLINIFVGTMNYFHGTIIDNDGYKLIIGRFKKPYLACFIPTGLVVFSIYFIGAFLISLILSKIDLIDFMVFIVAGPALYLLTLFFSKRSLSIRYKKIRKGVFDLIDSCL